LRRAAGRTVCRRNVGIVLAFVVEATAATGYALWLAGVF